MAYLLYLPYLSKKSTGEWSVGEWLEQSGDIFTDGGRSLVYTVRISEGVSQPATRSPDGTTF